MIDTTKKYAGFWNRFWAFQIDQIILLVVIAVIEKLFSLSPDYASDGVIKKIEALFSLLIAFGYFCLLESSQQQATIGKKIVGIKVTDMNANRISLLRSCGRTLAKVPSFFIFFIGFLMPAFTKRRQALHDIIAGCLVLKLR
jgi:uncharacterized RDD family membrane protein YckC